MTLKMFREKWNLSIAKAKKMLPYIDGAEQCPMCKGWDIPENAILIYIPDKRTYSQATKKYCYVMDAIGSTMLLNDNLSMISANEIPQYVRELKQNNLIMVADGRPEDSNDYRDYIPTLKGAEWMDAASKRKNEIITEMLKTIQELAKATQCVANAAVVYTPLHA